MTSRMTSPTDGLDLGPARLCGTHSLPGLGLLAGNDFWVFFPPSPRLYGTDGVALLVSFLQWKNCPTTWQGDYGNKKGLKSIILEVVVGFDTWV
ncbi:unnamed protein product [Prunus armeniaca]